MKKFNIKKVSKPVKVKFYKKCEKIDIKKMKVSKPQIIKFYKKDDKQEKQQWEKKFDRLFTKKHIIKQHPMVEKEILVMIQIDAEWVKKFIKDLLKLKQ